MENIFYWDKQTDLSLDFAFATRPPDVAAHLPMLQQALADMQALEAGAIANPDEGRMVGHYWLRQPRLAPNAQIAADIADARARIADFVRRIHTGEICGCTGLPFVQAVVIGIGGSSLGPRFVAEALKGPADKLPLYFIDNTDPDGMDAVFAQILPQLAQTLVIVISKSGGTVETQNALVEIECLFAERGLNFLPNAVRITVPGSAFDTAPGCDDWLASFPMWDWVGGRTSVLSAVGLLPLSLLGVDVDALLAGAAACDELGRFAPDDNPALLLALFWYMQTGGQGGHLMAVVPYKDRLELLAKYLQQLVMESLGKADDMAGRHVQQGLAVLGNKGSSDQHSYVQQLVAGPDNVFVVFVQVLRDRVGASPTVRDDSTSGDYLQAFMLGTAQALLNHGKSSAIITVPQVSAYYIGMLIALFERAVGFYASFVGINAYHQPAVEFGKQAASQFIVCKNRLLAQLTEQGRACTAAELARAVDAEEAPVRHILRHLAANRKIQMQGEKFWLGVRDE